MQVVVHKCAESHRAVDIPAELMQQLLALVEARDALQNRDAFALASRTNSGLERKVAREALKRAAKAAKLAPPHPTLHDLRHSQASMLIALDVSVVDVQRRLGHRKPDTTLRICAHEWKYREAQTNRVGRRLDRMLYSTRRQLRAASGPATNGRKR